MHEYKFKFIGVVSGDTVDGEIDLGFGISLKQRVKLLGIKAPESKLTKLKQATTDPTELKEAKARPAKAKRRLKELLKHAQSRPEGLFIDTLNIVQENVGRSSIIGDLKYIYARDLYNMKEGSEPWVGWQSVSKQLLNEDLVDLVDPE